jgi:hypothetical protein
LVLNRDEQKRLGRISVIVPRMSAASQQPFAFYVVDTRDFGATVKEVSTQPPIKIKSNHLFPIGFEMAPK